MCCNGHWIAVLVVVCLMQLLVDAQVYYPQPVPVTTTTTTTTTAAPTTTTTSAATTTVAPLPTTTTLDPLAPGSLALMNSMMANLMNIMSMYPPPPPPPPPMAYPPPPPPVNPAGINYYNSPPVDAAPLPPSNYYYAPPAPYGGMPPAPYAQQQQASSYVTTVRPPAPYGVVPSSSGSPYYPPPPTPYGSTSFGPSSVYGMGFRPTATYYGNAAGYQAYSAAQQQPYSNNYAGSYYPPQQQPMNIAYHGTACSSLEMVVLQLV
ncbi:hypothetical protein DAPPUDRAFT_263423 [Daphnia pulex]|uniref:Uncharacterized protein n=1 Tax=Daphnia pulex TaxID=6669 RepID=E9HPQ8_DAPPU|nr:hypothetical protein DAPPUDRAFT_263423 [Daphnia pulex]|eukprot:EFX66267.1 hypothetical protein DAPPUDRAFT_263423 [Daphnia pulex]